MRSYPYEIIYYRPKSKEGELTTISSKYNKYRQYFINLRIEFIKSL